METTEAFNLVELDFPVFAEQRSGGFDLVGCGKRKGVLHNRTCLPL
jgi:hypothetical protein